MAMAFRFPDFVALLPVFPLNVKLGAYLSDHGVVEEQLAEHDGRLVDHVEALGVGEDLLVLLGDPIPLLILENGRMIPAFRLLHNIVQAMGHHL